jgi:hypothetical protein
LVTSSPTKTSDVTSSSSSSVTSSPSSVISSSHSVSATTSESVSPTQTSSVSATASISNTPVKIVINNINLQNETQGETPNTNITEIKISALENQYSQSVDTVPLTSNPSFIGAIGGGVLLMAIIIVAAAVFTHYKRKQKRIKKQSDKEDTIHTINNLDIKEVSQENPHIEINLPQHVFNPHMTALKTKALQYRQDNVFTIDETELKARQAFNPMSATNKPIRQIQQLPLSKPVTAQPLDMYKVTKDRLSVKRRVSPPYVNENKVGFIPIKKELAPRLARTEVVSPTFTNEIETLNNLFKK